MAHTVYKRLTMFLKLFEIPVCFAHFDFFEISAPVIRIVLTIASTVKINIFDMARTVYIRFKVF